MNRIIKAAVITAIAGIGVIGTAGAASASVRVTDGVGFVGKGDVQNALGFHNDAELQAHVAANRDGVEFSYGWTKTYDNMLTYRDGTEIHVSHVITGTRVVTDQANTNKAGKVTDGWNLTGTGASTIVADNGGETDIVNQMVANLPTKGMPVEMRIAHDSHSTFEMHDLQVNGIPLPNTPVEVPAA